VTHDLAALPAVLAALPERRRKRVLDVIDRERAAERAREVYPVHLARYREAEAFRRTAEALIGEGFRFVTSRFVQSVMREGR
jgi:hypothetical protein